MKVIEAMKVEMLPLKFSARWLQWNQLFKCWTVLEGHSFKDSILIFSGDEERAVAIFLYQNQLD